MRIILIRHGATEWSVASRHTGVSDLPLTPEGREQASVTARAVEVMLEDGRGREYPRIFSSPLRRSLQTARIVCGPAATIVEDPRLREFHYGDYEGLTTAEIREDRPGWDIWRDGCPHGETAEEVGDRVDSFLSSIQGFDGTIMVFSHGHLLRIFAARAVGLTAQQGRIFSLDTAAVSMIEDPRGEPEVKFWNHDPSLYDPTVTPGDG
jgi:probable phosphoglycerate mutase